LLLPNVAQLIDNCVGAALNHIKELTPLALQRVGSLAYRRSNESGSSPL